jgi:hypothetical protein
VGGRPGHPDRVEPGAGAQGRLQEAVGQDVPGQLLRLRRRVQLPDHQPEGLRCQQRLAAAALDLLAVGAEHQPHRQVPVSQAEGGEVPPLLAAGDVVVRADQQGVGQVVVGVGRRAVGLEDHHGAERAAPDPAAGVRTRARHARNHALGQGRVEDDPRVVAHEVAQGLQVFQGAGQDAERRPEHGHGLTRLQGPRQGIGHGQVLEVADVQPLVQVGGEALEHHRLGGRCGQRRQLVVGGGEVVVVEAGLGLVVVAGGQVSEGTPLSRSRRPPRAVGA